MKIIDLKNKVSVVVGGVGDIGSKIAEALAEAGSETIITGRDRRKGDMTPMAGHSLRKGHVCPPREPVGQYLYVLVLT